MNNFLFDSILGLITPIHFPPKNPTILRQESWMDDVDLIRLGRRIFHTRNTPFDRF